jgi:hypothetical protein
MLKINRLTDSTASITNKILTNEVARLKFETIRVYQQGNILITAGATYILDIVIAIIEEANFTACIVKLGGCFCQNYQGKSSLQKFNDMLHNVFQRSSAQDLTYVSVNLLSLKN